MISSEVQRTLVKSAPELWSELSDEAALARRLSEFGEIRITRLTAEERIEWTAESARGSIHIKPSGWGTRVTLTVARDEPAVAVLAQSESEGPSAHPGATAPSKPDADAPSKQPEANAPSKQPDADVDLERPAADGSVEEETETSVAPAAARPPEAAPPPAATAALAAPEQLEPSKPAQPPVGAPSVEPERRAPDAPAPHPIPRRGFFRRVLSRWHRTVAPDPNAGAASFVGSKAPEREASSPADTPKEGAAREHAHSPTRAADAIAVTPPARTPPAPTPPARTPSAPKSRARTSPAPTPPARTLPATQPTDPPKALASATPPALASAVGSKQARTERARPAGTEASAESAPRVGSEDDVPAEPAPREEDLSAELRAAEEAGSGDDAAVLTAVLDSLGSAHHRPFSRS